MIHWYEEDGVYYGWPPGRVVRTDEASFVVKENADSPGTWSGWLIDDNDNRVCVTHDFRNVAAAKLAIELGMSDDRRVAAIRADEKVGRGSCSSLDECYSDAELAAALDKAGMTTTRKAVAWARRMDRIEREVYADRMGGCW